MGAAMIRCFAALARKAFANASAARCPRPMRARDRAPFSPLAPGLGRAARAAVGTGRNGEDFCDQDGVWAPGRSADRSRFFLIYQYTKD